MSKSKFLVYSDEQGGVYVTLKFYEFGVLKLIKLVIIYVHKETMDVPHA